MTRTLVAATVALTLAFLALVSWIAPAAADDSWNGEPLDRVSRFLVWNPTYVSPELRDEFSAKDERGLRAALTRSDVPVFLAVVPWGEDADVRAQELADYGGGEGYYLVVGPDLRTVHGAQNGMDTERIGGLGVAQMAAAVANESPGLARSTLTERLSLAADLLMEEGAAADAYREMLVPSSETSTASATEENERQGEATGLGGEVGAVVLWGGGISGALALTVLVVWGVRRWLRSPIRVVPLTEAVLDTVDSTQREVKRDQLTVRLTNCGRRVAEQQGDSERVQIALEAYEAAAKVMDSVDDMSDLVGVKVLLDRCEAALDRKASPGHCFFDPRHVEGTARVRWRAPASFASVTLLACRTCRRAIREHRTPEAVVDSSGPRPMPYFAVPAERSVWAATGYGTLAPDLAARILRGELRG